MKLQVAEKDVEVETKKAGKKSLGKKRRRKTLTGNFVEHKSDFDSGVLLINSVGLFVKDHKIYGGWGGGGQRVDRGRQEAWGCVCVCKHGEEVVCVPMAKQIFIEFHLDGHKESLRPYWAASRENGRSTNTS